MAVAMKEPTESMGKRSNQERTIGIAKEIANDLVTGIRRLQKTEDEAVARQMLRIALSNASEARSYLEIALVASPPTAQWVAAMKVQEIRDKGWDLGVVAYDPHTYENPTYYQEGDEVVPAGLATLKVGKPRERRPVGIPESTREELIHLVEVELRREADAFLREKS